MIDYEIVFATLPSIFMGSLIGLLIMSFINEVMQLVLFSITMLISIQITISKGIKLYK